MDKNNNHGLSDEQLKKMREESERMLLEEIRKEVDSMLGGKQMILKFKKFGRIKEEHIYDSSDNDIETLQAIQTVILFTATKKLENGNRKIEIGPHMIGRGWRFKAPWELHNDAMSYTKEEHFDAMSPIRVSDVIEQPKTVIVELESV